jgi:competence protein ComEC
VTPEPTESPRASVPRGQIRRFQIPRAMAIGGLMVCGVWLNDRLGGRSTFSISACFLLISVAHLAARYCYIRTENIALAFAIVSLGASLHAVRDSAEDGRDIARLIATRQIDTDAAIRLTGVVANIPALDSVVDSRQSGLNGNKQIRTLFLLRTTGVCGSQDPMAVRGLCRVLVEGDATALLKWGDHVELLGQLDTARPPLNPGEFDFQRHLQRSGISAMLFVKHAAAVQVQKTAWWSPGSLLTLFRQQTVEALRANLSPKNRATAEALLLGNRGHLTPDLERDFVASGTMHLLAISGLHVGILYVFLVRLLNMLLITRTRSLLLAGLVCVLYCFLTDLRPSVMRSTVFIALHVLGQICVREMRIGSLLGVTAIVLLIFDPSIAFDVGAWLSFLCVGALGWVAERTPAREDRDAPPEALTWQERLSELRAGLLTWIGRSYQQMLAVTLLSAPLVATQFHVVSLTGMLINLLLIPFTTATLIVGYVFIAAGLAVPPLAIIPGTVFGLCLTVLNSAVSFSADVRLGFVTIPDLPAWFLPAYYFLLAASALASRSSARLALRVILLALVTLLFRNVCISPVSPNLECTVLSVGHGNATVVETPDGHVLLFDAGALNRGERTADLISRFLWNRGHRQINAIVISHPDADHYNAVSSLLDRIPVGQLIITREFVRSAAPEVQAVLDDAAALSIPCCIAKHGDRLSFANSTIDFLQANSEGQENYADNASSLVSIISCFGHRICLPGDLEGEGQDQLLSVLPTCSLLVSPHHGSPASNTKRLAHQTKPTCVVVSAKDERQADTLRKTYAPDSVLMTSVSGAVRFQVTPAGQTTIETFTASATVDF